MWIKNSLTRYPIVCQTKKYIKYKITFYQLLLHIQKDAFQAPLKAFITIRYNHFYSVHIFKEKFSHFSNKISNHN